MTKNEDGTRGDAVRRALMGAAAVDRMAGGVHDDPILEAFGDFAREAAFAKPRARPGLDARTRTLICVVSDTATHARPELAIHLRMARRAGWSEQELSEALLHMAGYVGLPAARGAFAEMRAEPEDGLGR